MDRAARHLVKPAQRRAVARGRRDAGRATLGPDLRGIGMRSKLRFGPQLRPDGVTFRLWAPAARRIELMLDHAHPMQAQNADDAGAAGWHEVTIEGLRAGALYKYRVDGELEVPDPASHFQPFDVSGPSEVIDHHAFAWRASSWRGRPWAHAVTLELHVGTFTPGGTF